MVNNHETTIWGFVSFSKHVMQFHVGDSWFVSISDVETQTEKAARIFADL